MSNAPSTPAADAPERDVLDDMEKIHLSDTLELRVCLEDRVGSLGGDLVAAKAVLSEFESFMSRLSLGPFHLRPAGELHDGHRDAIRMVLAAVGNIEPERIRIVTHSLQELLCQNTEAETLIFRIAQTGSVGSLLRSRKPHATLLQEAGVQYVPYQLVEGLLCAADLPDVLRGTKYGISLSARFRSDIATFFTCVFAHTCRGNDAAVRQLLPLAKIFRSNMPIGLLPPENRRGLYHGHVFTA